MLAIGLICLISVSYANCATWPTAASTQTVTATIAVSGAYDGKNVRYTASSALGDGGQGESQKPIFNVANGGSVKNVIIGADGADGIHCLGTCTLENVWWEDVGEDAATFKGTSASQTMTISGGGAKKASDKVFQHNGPGTFHIKNFDVEDFGKLYRSCGNCGTQYARHVIIENIEVHGPGKDIVGINPNLGDTAKISGVKIYNDASKKIVICQKFTGVTSGEPKATTADNDGTQCSWSGVTYA